MFGDQNDQQQNGSMSGYGTSISPSAPTDNGLGTDSSSPINDVTVPAPQDNSAPSLTDTPNSDAAATSLPTAAPSSDLMDIKQQALQHLSPLVGHLDQTPEEKFRTTMMMIQASDNQDLVKDAFEAAKQITDDKARAQAFLDVINEINYFTQHNNS